MTDYSTQIQQAVSGTASALSELEKQASAISVFDAEECAFADALLTAGLSSNALREFYCRYLRILLPSCRNYKGISKVLGFSTQNIGIAECVRRLALYKEIKTGMYCYEPGMGPGQIVDIQEGATTLLIHHSREISIPMDFFLSNYFLVSAGSSMERFFAHDSALRFENRSSFDQAAVTALHSLKAITPEILTKVISAVMKPEDFLKIITPPRIPTPPKKVIIEVKEVENTSKRSWDASRSIVELEELITAGAEPEGAPNMEAVLKVLTDAATKPALAPGWARCVSLLQQRNLLGDSIQKMRESLQNKIAAWADQRLYIDLTDKMPGKLVLGWMETTLACMGTDFILATTPHLPCNLWVHAEKILSAIGQREAFVNQIFTDFKSMRATPDHFYWLWKNAPKGEMRSQYLAQSPALFKALSRTDLKGNFLKSQRELRKLLLTDDKFLTALMHNGDDALAAESLITCTKRQSLLEAREKQSLLVKIARLFPSFKELVEGNARSASLKPSADFPPHTSIRSYYGVQHELEVLISEQIPANTAAIGEARSRGDLSENSEYKYAKEQQRLLNKRRNELTQELQSLQAMDFRTVKPKEWVIPGSVITLTYGDDGHEEKVTMLGLHDGNPEKNFIAYTSPLGKVLLVKKLGTKVTLPNGRDAVISGISSLPEELLAFLNENPYSK